MTACPWPIEDLLPHARPMLLLDEALACDASGARAAVTIRPDSPFIRPEGVPAHVGIEFMAQTCGVWAGGEAKRQGGKARVGYLLGTRRYQAERPFFRTGERLTVTAALVFLDAGMGVFDCRIEGGDGQVLAQAQLSVYQPDDQGEREQP
jgi:predicted hotdog family 3-hydroxylacyl-ACP dehydratase